jgi:hypothetical protein
MTREEKVGEGDDERKGDKQRWVMMRERETKHEWNRGR